MEIKVGTFNLNNLFSRFNFRGQIDAIAHGDDEIQVSYKFNDPATFSVRIFQNRLVQAKPDAERRRIAERILAMDLDVLAVQEVEDLLILQQFNREDLHNHYDCLVLVEGNDPRLIDVAVLSKLPIGAVTSWRHAVHPATPDQPIFSRDLLEIEVLDRTRRNRLFTLYNNHLKSQFVQPGNDRDESTRKANLLRQRQAEMIGRIVASRTRPDARYVIVGDMNDVPTAPTLAPLVVDSGLGLVNGLADPQETRPAKADTPPPPSRAWTHRFKEGGQPAKYELFDQIWLSPALAARQTEAWIGRRTTHGGDGSDHDPAWVVLNV